MERVIKEVPPIPSKTEVSNEEKGHISGQEMPAPAEKPSLPRSIGLRQLINKLNSLNFQDRTVSVVFKHRSYQRTMALRAYPQPCQDARLVCRWADDFEFEHLVDSYQFQALYISKGPQFLEVAPEVKGINDKQITFLLPETCREVGARRLHRHACTGVAAYLFQHGAAFFGELTDFGAWQFKVTVGAKPPQTFVWLGKDVPVTVVFTKENVTLYSGECRILRHDQDKDVNHIILEPIQRQIRRFPPKEFRNTRHELNPPPDVIFQHPLFDKTVNLKIHDISGAGFSVDEEENEAVLLPGLILPAVDLVFGNGVSLRCMAQVIHCKPLRDTRVPISRCGLAILDMSVVDHNHLIGLMHQAADPQSYVSNKVDPEALWDFFFETGFIYPQKYAFIQANKEKIKATYQKLYSEGPGIASHFIYQDKGRILAHMAIMRFYESSWLIHHHAAIRSSYNRGGLAVLNQVGRFVNESHRLYSKKVNYLFCYYRPDNKFPSHVFSGAARNIKNPSICSIDLMAYLHGIVDSNRKKEFANNWRLEEAGKEDLYDLQTFYENESNGLMLRALHLTPELRDCSQLESLFHQIGLKRDRHIFALRYRDKLCAVMMVNIADLGLNMSDLTNSITFFVIDGQNLTPDLVQTAIDHVAHYYDGCAEVPVLLYPQRAAAQIGLDPEKNYVLWVLNTFNTDHYFRYLKRLLKFIKY